MIKLINNEFIKIKKSKLIFTQILIIISLILLHKYTSRDIISLSYSSIPFLGIIISILFSGIINSEIENGTLRFYLTKPIKRWKIYLAKYLCILIYTIITLLIIMILTILINGKIDKHYIITFIKYSVPLIFYSVFIIYLSIFFKNQSVTVGISIFILTFSLLISELLFGINFNIIEYTFFPYLDFTIFNNMDSIKEMNNELGIHLAINRGIIIDLVYALLFYILGSRKFIKKDIKN